MNSLNVAFQNIYYLFWMFAFPMFYVRLAKARDFIRVNAGHLRVLFCLRGNLTEDNPVQIDRGTAEKNFFFRVPNYLLIL